MSGICGVAIQTRGAMRQSERLVPRADAAIGDESRSSLLLQTCNLLQLDLDTHTCREIEPGQRLNRLWRRLDDVNQPLVGANLELFA